MRSRPRTARRRSPPSWGSGGTGPRWRRRCARGSRRSSSARSRDSMKQRERRVEDAAARVRCASAASRAVLGCHLIRVALQSNTLARRIARDVPPAADTPASRPPKRSRHAIQRDSPRSPAPFDLPPLQAEIRAQAQELAARFAERHREVRLHPSSTASFIPSCGGRSAIVAGPALVPAAHGGSGADCSPTSS